MKHFILCMLMTTFMINLSYAAQTDTECEMMSESTTRSNTKAVLSDSQPKPSKPVGSTAQ